ncbi:hypothetical protein Shewana3_2792 [Shewanella sp. ANA-3]|nr:hypothetical protein Shewana3_2792 [Shewanella sp. ANA-3]
MNARSAPPKLLIYFSNLFYFQGCEYECSLGNVSFQRIQLGLDSTYLAFMPVAYALRLSEFVSALVDFARYMMNLFLIINCCQWHNAEKQIEYRWLSDR